MERWFSPCPLDTYKKWEQRVNYIHHNPVDAQFVYRERHWKNSSYAAYEEGNLEQTTLKFTRCGNRSLHVLQMHTIVSTRYKRAPEKKVNELSPSH